MSQLGAGPRVETTVYLVGGATAVLFGWRATTIDVDIHIEPEADELLRRLVSLNESLELNVELASPADFLPPLPGWQERSPFIERHGGIDFRHYDLYAQALAKVERWHAQDLEDVDAMLDRGLIEAGRARELFAAIEPELYRYPAVDPPSLGMKVETVLAGRG